MLVQNQRTWQDLYAKDEAFLRYPADWIIRFHNMYLKREVPLGRVLDYGCGSANNAIFFIEKGYEVHGVDVAPDSMRLTAANLESKHLDPKLASRFSLIAPDSAKLPYADGFFDFVLANQVLYYLSSAEHIRKVCTELSRLLRPGGVVFFTMMGMENYYIKYYARHIHRGSIYEISIEDPKHRLAGVHEMIYAVRDEDELRSLFSMFEPVTIGHFEQRMFDLKSNFHWIFVGKKPA